MVRGIGPKLTTLDDARKQAMKVLASYRPDGFAEIGVYKAGRNGDTLVGYVTRPTYGDTWAIWVTVKNRKRTVYDLKNNGQLGKMW